MGDDSLASIARIGEAPVLEDGAVVHGIGNRGSVAVGGDADARVDVFVSTIDLAGNVSPASSLEVVFPPEFTLPGGCSSTRAPDAGVALVAFVAACVRGSTARSRARRR